MSQLVNDWAHEICHMHFLLSIDAGTAFLQIKFEMGIDFDPEFAKMPPHQRSQVLR